MQPRKSGAAGDRLGSSDEQDAPCDELRLEALVETSRAIDAAGDDPDGMFGAIVRNGRLVIPQADGAAIQMCDTGRLVYRAASGIAERLLGRRTDIGHGIAGRSLSRGRPILCPDVERENGIDLSPYRDAAMRAVIAIPLIRHKRPIGVLTFSSRKPAAFTPHDALAAELLASHLVAGLAVAAEETAGRAGHDASRRAAIAEALPQMIWTMTAQGETTYLNQTLRAALGGQDAQGIGSRLLSIVDPRCRRHVQTQWRQALATGTMVTFECRVRSPGDAPHWVLVQVAPLPGDDPDPAVPREWIGVATDIDRQKITEIDLQDAIRTRELLLHETNHRVKNSLQIAAGLLALHASRIAHPEARTRMMEARAQVKTIAQVHQAVSFVNQQNQIDLVALLRDLAGSLVGRKSPRRADLRFSAPETLLLPIDKGLPVALIAGEVITNALKHATGRPDSAISVTVSTDAMHHIVEVADNGPGLPSDDDLRQVGGLGMEIIFGLAQQAGGEIEIDRSGPGACLRLIVPIRT